MAEIDDGAALIFRTIQSTSPQLSAAARDALEAAFDGKKVTIADAKLFFDLLVRSDHPGDAALSGVIVGQNIVFTTKKKTVKLKSDPAQRHPAHAAVEAALSRVPNATPAAPSTETTKSTVKRISTTTTAAGKTSTHRSTLKSLLAKLSSASARRKAVRTAGRTGPPQPV